MVGPGHRARDDDTQRNGRAEVIGGRQIHLQEVGRAEDPVTDGGGDRGLDGGSGTSGGNAAPCREDHGATRPDDLTTTEAGGAAGHPDRAPGHHQCVPAASGLLLLDQVM